MADVVQEDCVCRPDRSAPRGPEATVPPAPGDVFDDDRLLQVRAHGLTEQTRHGIRRARRGERDNDGDRFRRVFGGLARSSETRTVSEASVPAGCE
jgi:hypothetical protein